jgi:hypothetical protein
VRICHRPFETKLVSATRHVKLMNSRDRYRMAMDRMGFSMRQRGFRSDDGFWGSVSGKMATAHTTRRTNKPAAIWRFVVCRHTSRTLVNGNCLTTN